MLSGISIRPLKKFADERDFFTEIMRKDWDIFEDDTVQTICRALKVRAWHKHERGQAGLLLRMYGGR